MPVFREVEERPAIDTPGVSIEPRQAVSKPELNARVAGHHEVNELTHSRLSRSGGAVARDDEFRQAPDHCVFARLEELGNIRASSERRDFAGDIRVIMREDPAPEPGELACRRRERHRAQDFSSFDSLACHTRLTFRPA